MNKLGSNCFEVLLRTDFLMKCNFFLWPNPKMLPSFQFSAFVLMFLRYCLNMFLGLESLSNFLWIDLFVFRKLLTPPLFLFLYELINVERKAWEDYGAWKIQRKT